MGSCYPYLSFYSGLKMTPYCHPGPQSTPITTWGVHLTKKPDGDTGYCITCVLLFPLLIPNVCGVLVLVMSCKTFCTF